ncbi:MULTISPECIES: hypothetical protein [Pseudomonas]|nr:MULTISPECIES: hypothetical protein [Pseudomonas]ETF06849.1 hypothetical protein PMO01_18545 [Pseudomonas moraviensis R28-S]WCI65296.1 hypothetical protein PMJ94_11395 [Pseudomonas aeruginosa]
MNCEDYDYQADKERYEVYIRGYKDCYSYFLGAAYLLFGSDKPSFEHCISVLEESKIDYESDEQELEITFEFLSGGVSLAVEVSFDYSNKAVFRFPNAKEWLLGFASLNSDFDTFHWVLATAIGIDSFEKGEGV